MEEWEHEWRINVWENGCMNEGHMAVRMNSVSMGVNLYLMLCLFAFITLLFSSHFSS